MEGQPQPNYIDIAATATARRAAAIPESYLIPEDKEFAKGSQYDTYTLHLLHETGAYDHKRRSGHHP